MKSDCNKCVNQGAWYAVQTKSRQERRALENLLNQNFACVLPLWKCERLIKGKLVLQEEPLFPGYLFIRLDLDGNWGSIRNTRGVTGLVRFGGEPAPVPQVVVEALMERNEPKMNLFNSGDPVKITSGAFAGLEGVFEHLDGIERVVIFLEFMHKQQRLSLPVSDVRRAA